MAFALYGPQLAFVTIRATPAYIFAAIAVFEAVRGRYRCFAWLAGATLFHVSSLLALIPITAVIFRSHFQAVQKLQNPKTLLTILFLLGTIIGLAGPTIFSAAQSVLNNIPFLTKYTVFLIGLADDGGISVIQSFSFGHFVFLFGISLIFFLFIVISDPIARNSAIFVIVGYVFYVFMFFVFSPIAAFRQTPFWLLPAFSIMPWHKLGWKGAGQIPFLVASLVIFVFQFGRILT